jgi:(5-formylfuran-3-yl)methyl phosphate synthase
MLKKVNFVPLLPVPLISHHQLLVSVQDAIEAQTAVNAGVAWIDLKNPSLGSLGQPDASTARSFFQVLRQPIAYQVRRSVALGELDNLNFSAALDLTSLFPIAKVGFAGLGSLGLLRGAAHGDWKRLHSNRPPTCQLVPAIYADNELAGSPDANAILELAAQYGSGFVLVDTFTKDGRNLFDWMSVDAINALIASARSLNAQMVVAGSLRSSDWPKIADLEPAILGVRGSLCTIGDDRSSRLCQKRLQRWLDCILPAARSREGLME